ncbi:hypothetical protein ACQ86N_01255 [Puia sp. P3]|uniref:hypothetical protein n=1 Tax=Puia sp. P3 TaxID=3423952 RepID=UPI003D673998
MNVTRELEIRHKLVALQRRTPRLRQVNDSTVQKIEDAVRLVVPIYKYTNLGELNALLSTQQVEAYR